MILIAGKGIILLIIQKFAPSACHISAHILERGAKCGRTLGSVHRSQNAIRIASDVVDVPFGV